MLRASEAALNFVNLGVAFSAMAVYAIGAWLPSFFIRHFQWSAAQIGAVYGPIVIATGVAGVLAAGLLGDLLCARGVRDGRLRVMAAAASLAIPFALFAALMPKPETALALFAAVNFLAAAAVGSGPAILQEMMPEHARGITHALAVLTVNLIALGLGPSSIALFTDYVLRDERQVGLSLAIMTPLMLLASASLAWAGRGPFLRIVSKTLDPQARSKIAAIP